MSGCKSCASCSPEKNNRIIREAQKLEKGEQSENPRYPHIFEGRQAIFSDGAVQMIVVVVADNCDENCDCFTLQSQRVLKNTGNNDYENTFDVTQIAGDNCWKLQALW
jgi:hypothetical protein